MSQDDLGGQPSRSQQPLEEQSKDIFDSLLQELDQILTDFNFQKSTLFEAFNAINMHLEAEPNLTDTQHLETLRRYGDRLCHIPEFRPRALPPHHTFLTTSPSPTPCLPTPQATFPPDWLSSGLVAAHRTLATPIPEARSRVGTFGDPGFAPISRWTSDIP
ncbi:uncharacterized protein EI90DRAFT_3024759 [Cantharellus anzutake]|uniref:uncharacterized protein n=1 Tax=Cantharellus anzutake TaxID=1750568 RepID=UPI0019082FBF|nr:uncharacterized protein EI90DRAFT_3024759 [Cantharellus anzutake]KAF8309947.1 hypothetical protein EI90DRAFT_3024759 [Cantharellus anzutake]